jgi:hypothetical protein
VNRRVLHVLLLVFVLLAVLALPLQAAAQDGILTYQSQPEDAALYQGDLAYIRDELSVPARTSVRIVLPPTTIRESLIITENGVRVRQYRYQIPRDGSGMLAVTLDATGADTPRELVLAYLATGAGWEPMYDMDVLEPDRVRFAFDAAIRNDALDLSEAEIRLVAGMPGADSDYRPDMTVTQMNVLYEEPSGVVVSGPIAINHVYDIGPVSVAPGEILRWNLVDDDMDARRLLAWDARLGQRTDVIYKVTNGSDVPFVAGPVQAYEDGLFIGRDQIEWTPAGSEGSITVAGLSSVRVRRTESVEDIGSFDDDRYRYTVVLAITNHGGEDIDLIVLDQWNRSGQGFSFSHEPRRQGNNVLRWELTIPAGESVEIEYAFIVD